MKAITEEMLDGFRQAYESDSHSVTMHAACARTELKDLVFDPDQAARLKGGYTYEVKTHGITAQKKSGRCWAFAALNMMRERVMEKCGLDDFQLSGNYLAFYDKLEKANNFLDLVVENADKPLDDRMMEYVLKGFHDGGYWDMDVDLVKKYGIVPKSAMPETYQSEHTELFMRMLNRVLRKDACILRNMIKDGKDVEETRKNMLAEVYRMECIVFGEPVKQFDFSWQDQDGMCHDDFGITPKEFFAKYVDLDLDAFVTLTCEPTTFKPLDTYYTFHYIGSMAESDVKCLNVSADVMEEMCVRMLKAGKPVWFGCDADAYGDRQEGVWDPESFDWSGLFGGVDFDMDRKDWLDYKNGYCSHAMLLVGVHLDENGKPDRWKIENSWGDEVGDKGYFVCSREYFQRYVYEAVIDWQYLDEKQKELLQKEPLRLEPWIGGN